MKSATTFDPLIVAIFILAVMTGLMITVPRVVGTAETDAVSLPPMSMAGPISIPEVPVAAAAPKEKALTEAVHEIKVAQADTKTPAVKPKPAPDAEEPVAVLPVDEETDTVMVAALENEPTEIMVVAPEGIPVHVTRTPVVASSVSTATEATKTPEPEHATETTVTTPVTEPVSAATSSTISLAAPEPKKEDLVIIEVTKEEVSVSTSTTVTPKETP